MASISLVKKPLPHRAIAFWLTLALGLALVPSLGSPAGLPPGCRVQLQGGPKRAQFPRGMVWGTATSAYQVEGAAAVDGRGPSIWDTFVHKQGKIMDGSTGDTTCNSYYNYQADVALMKRMGVQAYRFSISWSRVLPSGSGKVNSKGVAYYNRLINSLVRAGIKPAVTLYHWDLPQALQDKYNGWLGQEVVRDFAEYANLCFKLFGDRVKTWVTFNEPQVVALLGYGTGTMPPARCTACGGGNSATEPYLAARHILLAHAAAAKFYKQYYQKRQRGRIGITLESTFYYPLNAKVPADRVAAQQGMEFNIGWFSDAVVYGRYPAVMRQRVGSRLPRFSAAESRVLAGSVDFIGINCYTAQYASAPGPQPSPDKVNPFTDRPATVTVVGPSGQLIGQSSGSPWLRVYPQAIYSTLKWYHARYPRMPFLITENGVSQQGNLPRDKLLCDSQRVSFFHAYLNNVLKAIREGVPVQGYFSWSLLDNFEWLAGFTQRFGIHYVDFNSPGRSRIPKASAIWWSKFLRNQ